MSGTLPLIQCLTDPLLPVTLSLLDHLNHPLTLSQNLTALSPNSNPSNSQNHAPFAAITATLEFDITKDEPKKDIAFNQYLATIECIEHTSCESLNRGIHQSPNDPAPATSDSQQYQSGHTGDDEMTTFMQSIGEGGTKWK